MTAIIGFTCFDSVLMMADTEESTTQGKSSCDKLYHFPSPSGYVLTGGARDAHLIDCANQELQKFFGEGLPGTSPNAPLTFRSQNRQLSPTVIPVVVRTRNALIQ
jgi:hypothetical protein